MRIGYCLDSYYPMSYRFGQVQIFIMWASVLSFIFW